MLDQGADATFAEGCPLVMPRRDVTGKLSLEKGVQGCKLEKGVRPQPYSIIIGLSLDVPARTLMDFSWYSFRSPFSSKKLAWTAGSLTADAMFILPVDPGFCEVEEVTDSSTPNSQVIEAFSLCMFLCCTFYQTLPSGPPCSKEQGHRLQARHKIRCL